MSQEHWLNHRRVILYPRVFLIAFALLSVAWLLGAPALLGAADRHFGMDFLAFWSAGKLAISGDPTAAYDWRALLEASTAGLPGNTNQFVWSYPPTNLLFVMPFAAMPYPWALSLWTVLTVCVFVYAISRLAPMKETIWVAMAFPGVFLNVYQGQNGLLSAALLAGALMLLDRRPLAAGVLVGLLAFKPHLGVLIPFALAAGGYWRVFFSAAVTTVVFFGVAIAVTSWDSLSAFWANMPFAAGLVESGTLPWHKMPSVFVSLMTFGLPTRMAHVGQITFALMALGLVLWSWRRSGCTPPTAALLVSCTLLVSPHLNDHDLAILAVPTAMLAMEGLKHGWLRGERECLLTAWLIPVLDAPVAWATGVHPGLLVTFALIGASLRRIDMATRV